MPAQLLQRLRRFLDPQHARDVNSHAGTARVDVPAHPVPATAAVQPARNSNSHWPLGRFGNVIADVQSVMIHETSGWPSYASAAKFEQRFLSTNDPVWQFKAATATERARWVDKARGIGPQFFVDPNGTAFVQIGPENLAGNPRLTWHGNSQNSITLGIENSSTGDASISPNDINALPRAHRLFWWPLSLKSSDLTGMKAYLLLHPSNAEDAVLVWFVHFPQYTGSGDIADGANPSVTRRLDRHPNWRMMLITDRDYRTLALLCRLLAEQVGIPRNFPLLPYVDNDRDGASPAVFRQLILSDQRRDSIAAKLGTTTAIIQANGAAYANFYNNANRARIWSRFFGWDPAPPGGAKDLPCFRGFISHDINGGHPCPGPLFDWHRFAREVWDWWWYPFDTEPVAVNTTRRPYHQARRSTQLLDYYYDATGAPADYNRVRLVGAPPERFELPELVPVYAMANGVVVAARFAMSNDPVNSGFVLVRHEVFHRPSIMGNRINYDLAPTYVWSLTHYLSNAGFQVDQVNADNPEWLNRFAMRLVETELAVKFHSAPPANAVTRLNRGWAHNPTGAGPRLSTGEEIERDAAAYRRMADDLTAGRTVLFPLESDIAPTPVRVILGDFLGHPNRMPGDQTGVLVDIFSIDRLTVPGANLFGIFPQNEAWWVDATGPLRAEIDAAMNLPTVGLVWHYPMINFLEWINGIIWASEWQKYGTGLATPTRPISRRVV